MTTKEVIDSGVSRRRASAPKAGSVWETRMKLDEVKGGIKVFNANHQNPEENAQIVCTSTSGTACPVNDKEAIGTVDKELEPNRAQLGEGARWLRGKRAKSDVLEGSPIQIGRQRSEVSKNLDDKFKESSESADGSAKKSPVQTKKTRSVSVHARDGNSETWKVEIEELEGSVGKSDNIPLEKKSRSEEELGACEVNEESSNADNINYTYEEEEEQEENDKKIEVEIAEKDLEIKEINSQETKPKKSVIQEKKLLLGNQRSLPNPTIVKKQLPAATDHAKLLQNPTKINSSNSRVFSGNSSFI